MLFDPSSAIKIADEGSRSKSGNRTKRSSRSRRSKRKSRMHLTSSSEEEDGSIARNPFELAIRPCNESSAEGQTTMRAPKGICKHCLMLCDLPAEPQREPSMEPIRLDSSEVTSKSKPDKTVELYQNYSSWSNICRKCTKDILDGDNSNMMKAYIGVVSYENQLRSKESRDSRDGTQTP